MLGDKNISPFAFHLQPISCNDTALKKLYKGAYCYLKAGFELGELSSTHVLSSIAIRC